MQFFFLFPFNLKFGFWRIQLPSRTGISQWLVFLDALLLDPTEVLNFFLCRKWTLKKFGFDMTMLVCDQVS